MVWNETGLERLHPSRLEAMRAAGDEVLECIRVLEKVELNLVGEVLRGQGDFVEYEHFPTDDVFDMQTHAQYYYHAHRGMNDEHGHFHLFLRGPGMPEGASPVARVGPEAWPTGDDAIAHLIAISMDAYGRPIGLFTTNRWVTAETWYPADTLIRMLERFSVDHAYPSWPVNRWLTSMLVLFRPQIEALIRRRDDTVERWRRTHSSVDVFEDRNLEITSETSISIEDQIARVRQALRQPRGLRA